MALFHGFANFLTSGFMEDSWLLMRGYYIQSVAVSDMSCTSDTSFFSPENEREDSVSVATWQMAFTSQIHSNMSGTPRIPKS